VGFSHLIIAGVGTLAVYVLILLHPVDISFRFVHLMNETKIKIKNSSVSKIESPGEENNR
jgi:hypothetical protein